MSHEQIEQLECEFGVHLLELMEAQRKADAMTPERYAQMLTDPEGYNPVRTIFLRRALEPMLPRPINPYYNHDSRI